MIKIELTKEELDKLLNILASRPLKETYDLFTKLAKILNVWIELESNNE